MLFAQFHKPIALCVSECLWSIAAFKRGVIEIEHDFDGGLITDRPERHQQVLRSCLNETAAQSHHTFASFGFARPGLTSRKHDEPCSIDSSSAHFFCSANTVVFNSA